MHRIAHRDAAPVVLVGQGREPVVVLGVHPDVGARLAQRPA